MMGPRQESQAALFYEFSLEDHASHDHLVRSIDRFVDLTGVRAHLAGFYSQTGRPSIDPELLNRPSSARRCPYRSTASNDCRESCMGHMLPKRPATLSHWG